MWAKRREEKTYAAAAAAAAAAENGSLLNNILLGLMNAVRLPSLATMQVYDSLTISSSVAS